jgi:hypothetical protein
MKRAPHDTADRSRPARADGPATLLALRADFPHFRIWTEVTGDRVRYIARRRSEGTGPHTVVVADLGELRAVLSERPGPPVDPFSAEAPDNRQNG